MAEPISKRGAVTKAIGAQLKFEGRWPPNDTNKVMGKEYNYSDRPINTIGDFLSGVRIRLFDSTPAYYFQPDDAFGVKALSKTVAQLTGAIADKTSATKPDGWVDP